MTKTVVVTAGTTNEAAVKAISQKQRLGITIVTGRDHADSFAILKAGRAAAFATDDVLLYGLVATTKTPRPRPRLRQMVLAATAHRGASRSADEPADR